MSLAPTSSDMEPDDKAQLAWRAAPAAIDFILDIEIASRNGRDLVDSLLVAAIMAANVSAITRDADLQLAHAGLADSPPDDLRRPVSVNAIAHSLRMPFETARRRIQGLARAGAIEVTPRGVVVAGDVIMRPEFLVGVFARHQRLRAFYDEMKALAVVPPAPISPAPVVDPDDPPVRITNRVTWEYMLRVADDLGVLAGDVTNALILLAMIRENTEGFTPEQFAAWARHPIAHAHPVRNGQLAANLNVSNETLRRYAIALADQGLCVRGPKGLVAVAPSALRPALNRLVLDNLTNLQRLFARLRQLGVLASWEAEANDAQSGDTTSRR